MIILKEVTPEYFGQTMQVSGLLNVLDSYYKDPNLRYLPTFVVSVDTSSKDVATIDYKILKISDNIPTNYSFLNVIIDEHFVVGAFRHYMYILITR